MKQFFLLFIFALVTLAAYPQDVINKADGGIITAKVIEVTAAEVKYKSLTNPDGTVYSVPKMDVSDIVYADGTKLHIGGKGSPVAPDTLSQYDLLMRSSQRYKGWGIFLTAFGSANAVLGITAIALGAIANSKGTAALGAAGLIEGIALACIGPALIKTGKKKRLQAEQIKATVYFVPVFNTSPGIGIGMRCTF